MKEQCVNIKKMCGIIFLLISFCFSSCITNEPESPSFSPVYITNQAKYILLPPPSIDVPLDMAQHISGSYGKRQFVMDAWVQADASSITMTLLNSFGSNMGSLLYDGNSVILDSSYFPSALKPEYIIADFQFCFYRVDVLAEALRSIGLTLEINRRESLGVTLVEQRRILSGTKKIIEIEKTPHMIRYNNLLRNYSYTLEGDF
jgi:hypothetical protein